MAEPHQTHVFLSYGEENEAFVEALARRLMDDVRLSFWFRPWHAIPGEDLQEQMEQALYEAQSCAVFIGAGGLEGWQNEQMRSAIQARVEDLPGYRVIPVLLPGVAYPKSRGLPAFLRRYQPVRFRSVGDEQAFKELLAGILGIQPIEVEGFLDKRGSAAPGELPAAPVGRAEPAGGARPLEPQPVRPVEPSDYNLAVIRELLVEAFDPDGLRIRLTDTANPKLQPLSKVFGPNDNLPTMADRIITYCRTYGLLPDLLEEVKQANAYQYDRYKDRLRRTVHPEPAEPAVEERQFEPLHIDPDDPPIAAIRGLLMAAFQPESLRRFCQERRDFRSVLSEFGPGHGLDDMVDRVIDHCGTGLLWDTLLAEVARVSPAQYARFEPQLRQT